MLRFEKPWRKEEKTGGIFCWLLRELSGWLLLAALFYAPWDYGATGAAAIRNLNWLLAASFVCLLPDRLTRGREDRIGWLPLSLSLIILVLGWALTLNARSYFDADFRIFVSLTSPLPSLPGTIDYALSVATMRRVSALMAALWVVIDLAREPRWLLRFCWGLGLAGGFNGTENSAEAKLYDPATGTWSATGSLQFPRTNNIQVLLADGRVLVAGGVGDSPNPLHSTEIYDPALGLWSLSGDLSGGRQGMTATMLPNGRVFITGGYITSVSVVDIVEEFNPILGRWHRLANALSSPRFDHTATLLLNGNVIVAGGLDDTTNFVPAADLFLRPR